MSKVAFGAIYAPLVVSEEGRYLITLNYRFLQGHIAFGALTEDRSSWLGQVGDGPAAGANGTLEYVVDLRKGQKIWLLITNNRPRETNASRLVLKWLRGFEYATGAPSKF
jgi:hypothetical protein